MSLRVSDCFRHGRLTMAALLTVLVSTAVFSLSPAIQAQSSKPSFAGRPAQAASPFARVQAVQTAPPAPRFPGETTINGWPVPHVTSTAVSPFGAQGKELKSAMKTLRDEDASLSDKEDAQEKIAEYLGEEFDKDLKRRADHIENLERQIEQLKERIAKRREARDRLIELRMELLVNEAEGLGFPSAWNQTLSPRSPSYGTWAQPNGPFEPVPAPAFVPPVSSAQSPNTATPSPRTPAPSPRRYGQNRAR